MSGVKGLNSVDRKQVMQGVNELLNTYCHGCLLKSHFRKDYGKTEAHRFCIQKCTVGQQLKLLGEKLS
ncbi:zinc-finger domain-containing protein [Rossellomorea sp. BNER]|nr:zinc-finger domain-containing protein [Rossellomorea sp. BNER]